MILLSLALALSPAHANSTGKTGASTSGCNGCHTGGTAPSVALSAGSTTVAPGASTTVTFTVTHRSGSQTGGGMNVSATGGTLASGTGSSRSGTELTQTSTAGSSAGASSWSFSWTAPATEGTYTLRAAGNSVNRNSSTSGDSSSTTTLTIVVDDGCDDLDGDGFTNCASDCDDSNRTIFPGAPETCDGVDQDCDGTIDDSAVDATAGYRDTDGDGFGAASGAIVACTLPSGYVTIAGDCDDTSASVRPGAAETCDGADQDCDGTVDESATDAATWFRDADADGAGDASLTSTGCSAPAGYVASSDDCDDGDARVSPSALEACDAADMDEDCDGLSDDADPSVTGRSTFYADGDGDGFGGGTTTLACELPAGYASFSGDCADGDARRFPGASESCTATEDLNCDGSVGAIDGDGDGYFACDDCDDGDATIHPGAAETCDGVDNDCDGTVDGAEEVTDGVSFYADADGDGFGDETSTTSACSVPEGFADEAGDCDDTDATSFPAAAERWYDGVDQDCDGNDADQDGDGFAAGETGGEDCDDTRPETFPGAPDAPYDGVDSDCAGNDDQDADGDGFRSTSQGGDDCDDSRADVYPGAPDVPYDGRITDCDASDENDADDDGFDAVAAGGDDCDDARSDVNPSADEAWYDGVDQDCDGNDDDQDQDGVAGAADCDDTDASLQTDCEEEEPDDSPDDEAPSEKDDEKKGGGCASVPASGTGGLAAMLAVLGFLGLRRKR